MPESLIRKSTSVLDTELIGEEIAPMLKTGDVVALFGELGAGKTCLIRGLARRLGCGDPVTSPTFTLINEYQSEPPLYHFDLYRLRHPAELEDIGYEEYFYGTGICVVEWPERAGKLLPARHWEIRFTIEAETCRHIEIIEPTRERAG